MHWYDILLPNLVVSILYFYSEDSCVFKKSGNWDTVLLSSHFCPHRVDIFLPLGYTYRLVGTEGRPTIDHNRPWGKAQPPFIGAIKGPTPSLIAKLPPPYRYVYPPPYTGGKFFLAYKNPGVNGADFLRADVSKYQPEVYKGEKSQKNSQSSTR